MHQETGAGSGVAEGRGDSGWTSQVYKSLFDPRRLPTPSGRRRHPVEEALKKLERATKWVNDPASVVALVEAEATPGQVREWVERLEHRAIGPCCWRPWPVGCGGGWLTRGEAWWCGVWT